MSCQKGFAHLFLLIAGIGVLGFLLLTQVAPFKNTLLSSLFPKPASQAASLTDWTQLQHDSQHTGRTTEFVPPNYKLAWAWVDKNHIVKNFVNGINKSILDGFEPGFKLTDIVAAMVQPIIAEGKVFFGTQNGKMIAVDALTGDNKWEFSANGPILGSAAYSSGVVVFASMDGNIYGRNSLDGTPKWAYQTGAGINAAPIISGSTVFVGSRDGAFYAVDLLTGSLKWKYTTRVEPVDPASPFNKAPIVSAAAVSEDGATVLFGSENLHFFALNTADGSEKWVSKKINGQSFIYTWPVVKDNKVIVRTMNWSQSEFVMEDVLDAVCAYDTTLQKCTIDPAWSDEKTAILNWLTQNPTKKSMYVFDINTGTEPYQVAMGLVAGENKPPQAPVIDNLNRVLTDWRISKASFFDERGTFGTKHCMDLSPMDLNSGDRIKLTNTSTPKFCPEQDNSYQYTVGGNYLYLSQLFRGTRVYNLTNGQYIPILFPYAKGDGGDNRLSGYQIIPLGNDSQSTTSDAIAEPVPPFPEKVNRETWGFMGASIATTSGVSMLYVNNPYVGAIMGIRSGP